MTTTYNNSDLVICLSELDVHVRASQDSGMQHILAITNKNWNHYLLEFRRCHHHHRRHPRQG